MSNEFRDDIGSEGREDACISDPWTDAVVLARKGRFREAEPILRRAEEDGCTRIQALDLRARMCAQQGMFLEARRLWRKALELDPGNSSFEMGLARLRLPRAKWNPHGVAWAMFVAGLGIAVTLAWNFGRR